MPSKIGTDFCKRGEGLNANFFLQRTRLRYVSYFCRLSSSSSLSSKMLMHAISVKVRVRENELAPLDVLEGISAAPRVARSLARASILYAFTCFYLPAWPFLAKLRSRCSGFGRRGRAEEVSSGRARGKRTVSRRPSATTIETRCTSPPEVGEIVFVIAGSNERNRMRKKRKKK